MKKNKLNRKYHFMRVKVIIILLLFLNVAKAQYFNNPVLAGFYPDPSICKAGDDYYLVNSTFAYFPGLPIFHSKDLLNWQQIGHALTRPGQLILNDAGVSDGLFAPSIEYNNGLFYIVCTNISGIDNFVITAKNPVGPWSNSTALPAIDGIDPSLFFDDDGKTYIVYNSIPPENQPLYDGHRTIRLLEFDTARLMTKGENRIIVNGGTDINKKPVWIEDPHLFKRNGWYYLICAEGGTGYHHSEVVFRAKTLNDKFIPYKNNPILTQRQLDPNRLFPVTSTGHADFIEDGEGNWWAFFLGCRPYKEDFYNTGRETFMAPVNWEDDWPVIDLKGSEVKYQYPIKAKRDNLLQQYNSNFRFVDKFQSKQLNNRFVFLRPPTEKWYQLGKKGLTIKLQPQTCSEKLNPSFIGFRQSQLKGTAMTGFHFSAKNENEKAGLLVFQNEIHYYFLAKSIENGKPVIQLFKGNEGSGAMKMQLLFSSILEKGRYVYFKVEADNGLYRFFYSIDRRIWKQLGNDLDGAYLSTHVAGGFVGVMYAMYATSNGKQTTNTATFNFFEITNNDDPYK